MAKTFKEVIIEYLMKQLTFELVEDYVNNGKCKDFIKETHVVQTCCSDFHVNFEVKIEEKPL